MPSRAVGSAATFDAAQTPHAQIRIYAIDMSPASVGGIMEKLGTFLGGAMPSLTGIGVNALASPAFLLEIEMVVRLPD